MKKHMDELDAILDKHGLTKEDMARGYLSMLRKVKKRVVLLSRNTVFSPWCPEGYGGIIGETTNYYLIHREDVNLKTIFPKKSSFYKYEVLKEET